MQGRVEGVDALVWVKGACAGAGIEGSQHCGKANTELSQCEGDENFLLRSSTEVFLANGVWCVNCSIFLPVESLEVCLQTVPHAVSNPREPLCGSCQRVTGKITCAAMDSEE